MRVAPDRRRVVWLASLLAALGVLAVATPWSTPARGDDAEVIRDLRYDRSAGSSPERNALDLFLPVGVAQYPMVLFVHGGNWSAGDKNEVPGRLYDNVGHALARRGVGVGLVNYRLSDGSEASVTHPAHVSDIAAAVSFVRAYLNARGTDPTDLFLVGHDAGAHLAALVATNGRFLAAHGLTKRDIRGVAGLSGIYRIDASGTDRAHAFGTDPQARWDASPVDHVSGDEPPMLLLHAVYDLPDRASEAETFARALREAGGEAVARRVEDRDHWSLVESIGESGDVTTALLLHFVNSHLEATPTPTRTPTSAPSATIVPTATSGAAAQPTAPPRGPGGTSRTHASSSAVLVERGADRAWVVVPSDPSPPTAPVAVVLGGVPFDEREVYEAWLDHLARDGTIVVMPDFRLSTATDASAMEDAALGGYEAARSALAGDGVTLPDDGALVWMGHGAGAMIGARLAASWFDRGLPEPRGLLMLMPRRPPGPRETLRRVPRDTRTLIVQAEDDGGADPDLQRDIWRGLVEVPGAWRQELRMRTDRHGTPALTATFRTPFAQRDGADVADAHDWYGIWKWSDALVACARARELCDYAFGDTDAQRFMGRWTDGVAVREPEVWFGPELEIRRTSWLPLAGRP